MIRVLVVDDSPTVRQHLGLVLADAPDLQVVGAAVDGLDAVAQAERLRPDVIVMDVYMPRMDGYEATRQIMQRVPTAIVMVSTAARREELAMTFDALKAGALTVLEKPGGLDHPDAEASVQKLIDTVRLMAQVKVVRHWPRRDWTVAPVRPVDSGRRTRVVAIGASTGGPQVLADVLGNQARDFPVPILVVQHIALGFTVGLAKWMAQGTQLSVKVATAGEVAQPGTVYLAPDALQMGVSADGRIRLTPGTGEHAFCPSISHLFDSVAAAYGRAGMGILLTGMGRDGAAGLKAIHEAGGVTIAQDKESSVIFGMPAEAIKLGAARHVMSPDEIAATLRALPAGR
jgi:two-component system, chemotaxis family, protein-glutamate methylesterase/glutaminase